MTLRCSTFKPLVVLIKPPGIDKLKQLKVYGGGRSTSKLTVSGSLNLVKTCFTKKNIIVTKSSFIKGFDQQKEN